MGTANKETESRSVKHEIPRRRSRTEDSLLRGFLPNHGESHLPRVGKRNKDNLISFLIANQ